LYFCDSFFACEALLSSAEGDTIQIPAVPAIVIVMSIANSVKLWTGHELVVDGMVWRVHCSWVHQPLYQSARYDVFRKSLNKMLRKDNNVNVIVVAPMSSNKF